MLYCEVVEKLPFLKGEKGVDFSKEKELYVGIKLLRCTRGRGRTTEKTRRVLDRMNSTLYWNNEYSPFNTKRN